MNELPNFGGGAYDARGNGQMTAELAAQEWPGYVEMVMITVNMVRRKFSQIKRGRGSGASYGGRHHQYPRRLFYPQAKLCLADFRAVGLKAGVPCVLERSGAGRERRHGDGAIAKLMAFYAYTQDENRGCQPMTYEAARTENRCRTGGKDIGNG